MSAITQSLWLIPALPLAAAGLSALLKQRDNAITTLRKAVELGYRDFEFMRDDHDLDSIRKDPRFGKLLREFSK